ncbi:response regulator [Phenylobacterium sp.]|uniref:response regulator n=1 Tax=Phenylobacterium sp. TaxID=1871053 RepID=UPI0035C8390A
MASRRPIRCGKICVSPSNVHTPLADYALRGSRLLVVDDNRVNRELVKALLSPFGVVITEAEDGLQAGELAAAEPFDLILMDMRMPRCDGPDATLRIRQNEGPNRQVTIPAFTADYDLQVVGEQAVRGFDGVVRKPLDGSSLFIQVAEALVR